MKIIQDDLVPKSLILSAKIIFPKKVTFTDSRVWNMDISFESVYSTHYRLPDSNSSEAFRISLADISPHLFTGTLNFGVFHSCK